MREKKRGKQHSVTVTEVVLQQNKNKNIHLPFHFLPFYAIEQLYFMDRYGSCNFFFFFASKYDLIGTTYRFSFSHYANLDLKTTDIIKQSYQYLLHQSS